MFFKFFKQNYYFNIDKNKPTLMFDFDGTIADTFELLLDIVDQYNGDFGVEIADRNTLNKLRGMTAKKVFKELNIPLFLVPFVTTRIKNEMFKRSSELRPFDKVIKQIKNLKKSYNIGIVSNNSKKNIDMFINNNNLSSYFDFIVAEKNTFKKDKAISSVIKQNNLDINKVLYIGDEAKDIESCKKANVKILAVTWGFNNKKILSENNSLIIDDQNQLESIIKEILK